VARYPNGSGRKNALESQRTRGLGPSVISVAHGTDVKSIPTPYPPDTFGLTNRAKMENCNVKAYYNRIGCAFAGFSRKYGAAPENIIDFGGIPDNEKTRAFLKLHKEVTGIASDFNACPYFYANGTDRLGVSVLPALNRRQGQGRRSLSRPNPP
jgi:hypothetical protein